jgi:hypothetical protein
LSSRHGPNSWANYWRAHEGHTEGLLREGFAVEHTLDYFALPGAIKISGHIACRGRIVIWVYKILEVSNEGPNRPLVKTVNYTYNAFVAGYGSFLRHDNAHAHPGHADAHHCHEIDWWTRIELPGSPYWCGEDGWPTLADFVRRAHDWYDVNKEELPDPDAVVDDLARYDDVEE